MSAPMHALPHPQCFGIYRINNVLRNHNVSNNDDYDVVDGGVTTSAQVCSTH